MQRKRKTAEEHLAEAQAQVEKYQALVNKKRTKTLIKLGEVIQENFGKDVTPESLLGVIWATVNTLNAIQSKHWKKGLELRNNDKMSPETYDKFYQKFNSFQASDFKFWMANKDKSTEEIVKLVLEEDKVGNKNGK